MRMTRKTRRKTKGGTHQRKIHKTTPKTPKKKPNQNPVKPNNLNYVTHIVHHETGLFDTKLGDNYTVGTKRQSMINESMKRERLPKVYHNFSGE